MTALPMARFHQLIADAPLISIDLVVVNSRRQVLLGLRRNAPARGTWFVPGGRIRKGELLDDAMSRLLETELGGQARGLVPQWLGLYEHHYPDSVAGASCPTHYVVLAHRLDWPDGPDGEVPQLPAEQHADYCWMPLEEAAQAAEVHVHSRWYVQDLLGQARSTREYP